MNTVFKLVTAFTAGAVAMYYLDPSTGRRRRAMARDQGMAARHDVEDYARAKSKRAADQIQGTVAKARAKVSSQPIGDEQLHARIRTKLGRLIEHPSAVSVEVHDGHVVLSGNVSAEEIDEVANAVSAMRGVEDVDNRLSAGGDREESQDGQEARH